MGQNIKTTDSKHNKSHKEWRYKMRLSSLFNDNYFKDGTFNYEKFDKSVQKEHDSLEESSTIMKNLNISNEQIYIKVRALKDIKLVDEFNGINIFNIGDIFLCKVQNHTDYQYLINYKIDKSPNLIFPIIINKDQIEIINK